MGPERYAARRDALRAAFATEQLDGLIVTHLPNIRYLTGFSGTAAVVLVVREAVVLFTDFRYRTQAEAEGGDAVRLEVVPSDVWERFSQVVAEYTGVEVLGYESQAVTVLDAGRFTRFNGRLRIRPVSHLVERLRVAKDSDEVSAIRAAARIAGEALEATLRQVHVGQRELDVAALLESELRRRGSEWHPFPTIVASGSRSALPHARTSTRLLERGDWLLLDFGAQVDGYCADITRTVVVGAEPDQRQRAIYQMVREAQQTARGAIHAGMTGRDADALARGVIEARGFADAFGHSLGHGLGLEVHEGPRLSRANADPLPAHAVVTVEPGAYFPGWGGVRIEDDLYLGPQGPELLSDGRTELMVVG